MADKLAKDRGLGDRIRRALMAVGAELPADMLRVHVVSINYGGDLSILMTRAVVGGGGGGGGGGIVAVLVWCACACVCVCACGGLWGERGKCRVSCPAALRALALMAVGADLPADMLRVHVVSINYSFSAPTPPTSLAMPLEVG